MAKAKISDQYVNKLYGSATESGANTLTFNEINTAVSVFDKVGWVLSRLEWYLPLATMSLLQASTDSIEMALTSSDQISDLSLQNPSVIDVMLMTLIGPADVTGENPWTVPIIRDFSGLPGGGLIIAPRPLFVAIQGASLASAATVRLRGYFRQLTLGADDYLELIDFYRIVQ